MTFYGIFSCTFRDIFLGLLLNSFKFIVLNCIATTDNSKLWIPKRQIFYWFLNHQEKKTSVNKWPHSDLHWRNAKMMMIGRLILILSLTWQFYLFIESEIYRMTSMKKPLAGVQKQSKALAILTTRWRWMSYVKVPFQTTKLWRYFLNYISFRRMRLEWISNPRLRPR